MSIKDLSKFKINNSHTLEEYFFNYGKLYYKGKLLKFHEYETDVMDPKRKYWEIKDKKGVTWFYEVPYGNRFLHFTRPTYVKHRTAKRWAFGIIGGTAALSCMSFAISKKIFIDNHQDRPILEATNFKELYTKYTAWKEDYPEEDPLKTFRVDELANIAMANSLYEGPSDSVKDRHMMVVGYGENKSNAIVFDVIVNVSNCFIKEENGNAQEESLSYGSQIVVPKVGKRDFYTEEDKKVNLFKGVTTDYSKCNWENSPHTTYSKDKYEDTIGKNPTNPFLYTITYDSVLTNEVYDLDPITKEKHFGNSYVKRDSNGEYDISLDIHNILGVGRYIKRIYYMSNQDVAYFDNVNLKLHTDKDLVITSSIVNEKYAVTSLALKNEGVMKSKFYYEDVPSIPDAYKGEEFDFSKYKF